MTSSELAEINLFKIRLYIAQAATMLNQQAIDIAALDALQELQVKTTIMLGGRLSRLTETEA